MPIGGNLIEKKMSRRNVIKMQWFLTILFALLLCYNTPELAAVTAGHKSVCEQRYH